uniref:Uncharacterized protein n=1 Tax=Romanomermis culicivorax TaxID=13658 RepID=A0A915IPV7_ROMCU
MHGLKNEDKQTLQGAENAEFSRRLAPSQLVILLIQEVYSRFNYGPNWHFHTPQDASYPDQTSNLFVNSHELGRKGNKFSNPIAPSDYKNIV